MKGGDSVGDDKIGKISGGYINHALSGSGGSLDLVHPNGSQILQNSHKTHREIQGSSDFICKFLDCISNLIFSSMLKKIKIKQIQKKNKEFCISTANWIFIKLNISQLKISLFEFRL